MLAITVIYYIFHLFIFSVDLPLLMLSGCPFISTILLWLIQVICVVVVVVVSAYVSTQQQLRLLKRDGRSLHRLVMGRAVPVAIRPKLQSIANEFRFGFASLPCATGSLFYPSWHCDWAASSTQCCCPGAEYECHMNIDGVYALSTRRKTVFVQLPLVPLVAGDGTAGGPCRFYCRNSPFSMNRGKK